MSLRLIRDKDWIHDEQPVITLTLQQWWTDTYGRGEWRNVPVIERRDADQQGESR
jgi:hypothetical protein